jgi:hypothetical protein
MWVGDVEGATLAMGLSHSWTATWLGGAAGLTAGAFAGWWLDDLSPNYGRVSLIQSSALLGAVAGAIAISAIGRYPVSPPSPSFPLTWNPNPTLETKAQESYNQAYDNYRNRLKQRMAWGMLAGVNVGLAAGLAMAYLPDQSVYGPSWQRVIMVDLAGLASAVFATTIELCSRTDNGVHVHCADSNTALNGRTARFALVGGGLGLFAGWLLTMNFDHDRAARSERPPLSFFPMPGVVPVESTTGGPQLLPGLMSQGRF